MLTVDQLAAISGRPASDVMRAVVEGLRLRGAQAGLRPPHRLVQFIAQIAHESACFEWVEEVWGPTSAQKRYEGRLDLGNVRPGDGFRFRGRTVLQVTGRANYAAFEAWARRVAGRSVPSFTDDPDAILRAPWAGLAPIWFWEVRPQLTAAADRGDIVAVTRVVNGGVNGLADRQALYVRAALVMLGHGPRDVRAFQVLAGIAVDGIAGPETRAALHRALMAQDPADYELHHTDALPEGWWIVPGALAGLIAAIVILREIF